MLRRSNDPTEVVAGTDEAETWRKKKTESRGGMYSEQQAVRLILQPHMLIFERIMARHVATASVCIYSSATVKAGNPRVDYSLMLV